jgi:Flp pilus assembly protein TadD
MRLLVCIVALAFATFACRRGGVEHAEEKSSHQAPRVEARGSQKSPDKSPDQIAYGSSDFYRSGDLDAAINSLVEGNEMYPEDSRLRFMLGNAYLRKGEWEDARASYQTAIKLKWQFPDAHLSLGYACYYLGDNDGAIAAWRDSATLTPEDALPVVSLAVAYETVGQRSEAQASMARCMRLDPDWYRRVAIDMRWTEEMRNQVVALSETCVRSKQY